MAHSVDNPSQQNYYFKNDLCYTEDHIVVQKLYLYNIPAELKEAELLSHFNNYGRVLNMKVFGKPGFKNAPSTSNTNKRRKQQPNQRHGKPPMQTGFVFFAKPRDAAKSLHSRIHHVNGHRFNVQASDSWHQPDASDLPRYPVAVLPTQATEPPQPADIFKLNDHCLEHVLQFLYLPDQVHFARTCIRFRDVYQLASPRLHKSLFLQEFEEMTVWDMRDFFSLSGRHVQIFRGVIPPKSCERFCDFFGVHCINLKTLTLFSGALTKRNMHKMFVGTKSLEDLTILNSSLTDGSIAALGKLTSLKSLNLAGNDDLTGFNFDKLPQSIETLTLAGCCSVSSRHLTRLCKRLTHLKELNIKDIPFSSFLEFCKDPNTCSKLEKLRLNGCEQTHYEDIAKLPSLKSISLNTMPSRTVRPEFLTQLIEHKSEQLEHLELRAAWSMSSELLLKLAQLSGLRTLVLPHVEAINDQVLEEFTHLKHLQHINLKLCNSVSDSAVLGLILGCPKLKELQLQYCPELSDRLVHNIISKVRLQLSNKENQRQLPIKLYVEGTKIQKLLLQEPEVQAKDIVELHFSPRCPTDLPAELVNIMMGDVGWDDPNGLALDSDDDDMDYLHEQYMFDMGFMSDEDDDFDDVDFDSDDSDLCFHPYVHPSYPYDSDGEFMGFGVFGLDDSD